MELGVRIVEFANLDDIQLVRAAHVLREALPSPAGYKAPGEAEAEVARVLGQADRFGYAALIGSERAGWIGAVLLPQPETAPLRRRLVFGRARQSDEHYSQRPPPLGILSPLRVSKWPAPSLKPMAAASRTS
jgi:hypothetical protein